MGDSETTAGIRGHARHVGRVGALAFALGVGGAVLTGTAVASAETPESSPPSVTTSTSSESESASAATDAGPSVTDDQTSTEDATEEDSEAAEENETEETSEEAEASSQAEEEEPGDDTAADDDAASGDREPSDATAQAAAADPAEVEATEEPSFFERLFDNKTPTLDHRPAENELDAGNIVGDLHPEDPDSTRLTYTATTPAHGSVVIDTDGRFVYTPGESYAGQDSFQVTVSDARSGFHIHGVAGLLNLFTFGLLGSSGHRSSQTVFIGYERATVVSGLDSPVDFRFLPDGRILVAEKAGAIRVVEDGVLREDPLITLAVRTESERGIEGLAVDPDFGNNGRIYVAYIDAETTRNTLSRFIVNGNTATLDDVLLVASLSAAPNHHGGALGFGPDNKLYWGVGDNATGANAQNLDNIHGKILRLNTDGSVPVDNPVINGARTHIYAYGLRNPFRLTFTPTGQLLVADVGAASFEEVNLVTAGGNYGWPSSEGVCTSACTGKTDPIFTYPRGSGAAITSVAVYQGKVFIADLVQGWIRYLTCTPDYTSCRDVQTFDPAAGTTVVLTAGSDGNLYQLTYSPGALIAIKPAGEVNSEV